MTRGATRYRTRLRRRVRLAAYGLLHNPDDALAVLGLDAFDGMSDAELCAAIDRLIACYPSLAINPPAAATDRNAR